MLKWLLTVAVVVVLLGLVTPLWRNHRPGKALPGDLSFRWRGQVYSFPFATTILLSALFVLISHFV